MVEPKIVRQMLIRPEGDAPEHNPILIFEGDTRTGKTLLLHSLARGWTGKIPYSFLDVAAVEERLGEDALPELLAAIAAQLSRRCVLYGSLRFDRLVIGLKAAQLDLDDDPATARKQVEIMLTERLGLSTLKKVLTGVAQQALNQVPSPVDVPGDLVQLTVDAVVDGAAGRLLTRNALGRARSWYAHRDRQEIGDAVGQLIDLNTALRTPELADPGSQAGELLCDALLADLRDNFRYGRHADEWAVNCLVLLDNVDCALGTTLFRTMTELGALDLASGVSLPAPWVLAGTSRGGFLGRLPLSQRTTVLEISTLTDLNTAQGTKLPWARRRLPFLTADDIRKLVATVPEARRHPNLGSCVHLVTGGHPGATMFLLDAAGTTFSGNPEHLLDAAHGISTVRDALTDHLVAEFDEADIETLITCSAAHDRRDGRRLAARVPTDTDLPLAMWDDTGEHPTTVVRALLLRKLADRAEDHPWSWRRTHEFLATAGPNDPTAPARLLHHTLALDETTAVLDKLTQSLGTLPLPEWLALLLAVTSAPARGTRTAATGSWPGFLPSLVNRLWTAADPLSCANRRTLHTRIAGGLGELATHLDDTCDELTDLTTAHQARARRWRPTHTRSATASSGRFEGVL